MRILFDRKLKLLMPVGVTNSYGEERTDYTEQREVWAWRKRLSGRRTDEAQERFADYTAEFCIRLEHPVGEGWRVQEVGGYLYTVATVEDVRSKGMRVLVCERVND